MWFAAVDGATLHSSKHEVLFFVERWLSSLLACGWRCFDCLSLPWSLLLYALLWPVLEVLFVFRMRYYLRIRSAQRTPHDAGDTAEVLRFWNSCMSEWSGVELKELAEGWFLGEGPLCKGNLDDLVSWTLFGLPPSALATSQRKVADGTLQRLHAATARAGGFPDGHNPERRCMTHTLGELPPCWKPLIFYLGWRTARKLAGALLRRRGFVHRAHGGVGYFYHPGGANAGEHASEVGEEVARLGASEPPPCEMAPARPPLVLLHGVGGFWPYVPLLLALRSEQPTWPLIVPEFTHCSMALPPYEPPPPTDTRTIVLALIAIIHTHSRPGHPPKAAFLAHSLGSAVFASLAKEAPQMVAASLLVDPSAPPAQHALLAERALLAQHALLAECAATHC